MPKPVKVKMSGEDWKDLLNTTKNWFDNGVSFSALRVGVLPPSGADFLKNTAAYTAYFFNGQVLPKSSELDWSIEIGEDTHLVLQLFKFGHSNRVWDKFVFNQKEYADGGCNIYRTSKIINECHQKLIDAHPKYVFNDIKKFRTKKFNDENILKLKIKWNKAYKDSKHSTLEKFI